MSGTIIAILSGVGAVLLAIWKAYASGKKTGVNQQKIQEAKDYAQSVDRAAEASRARNDVLVGRVPADDKDPYRRD